MALTSAIAQGTLGTSVSTVATGANSSEHHTTIFRNSGGSTRVVTLYVNGSGAANEIATIQLLTGEFAHVKTRLGNTDTLQAKQDAGSDVYWTDEMDILP